MNICYSPGILDEMNIRKGFRVFMIVEINIFFLGVWGDVEFEDAAHYD